MAVSNPRPKSTRVSTQNRKDAFQHPSFGWISFSCWVARGPRRPPLCVPRSGCSQGLITGVAGRRNGEQTTVLSELPTVWVESHTEGYGIRGLAFSANPANGEKSFHNAHHNVNASITLGSLPPNEGDCNTFVREPMMLRCICDASVPRNRGGKLRSEILSRAGIFPWVV